MPLDPFSKILRKKAPATPTGVAELITAYEQEHPKYAVEITRLASQEAIVGIEIEVEKVGNTSTDNYPVWSIKADNSLRDGVEFVSTPIHGPRIHFALNQFYALLSKKAVFSPRTSIHIHLNILDLTPPVVGNLVTCYTLVEKLLYRFIGNGRDKNNFCVPFYESHCIPYQLAVFFFNPYVGVNINEGLRYSGLNLDAIRKFGTLEFRHLGGTRDKDKIINWINLILRLRNYAKTIDTEVLKQAIAQLNTESNYSALLDDILGSDAWLLDRSNLQRDMEGPASELKRAIFPNEKLQEMKQNVKDQYWMKQLNKKDKSENDFILELGGMPQPAARRDALVPHAAIRINPRNMDAVVQQANLNQALNAIIENAPAEPRPYRW